MSDELPYACGHCEARYYGEEAAEGCCFMQKEVLRLKRRHAR